MLVAGSCDTPNWVGLVRAWAVRWASVTYFWCVWVGGCRSRRSWAREGAGAGRWQGEIGRDRARLLELRHVRRGAAALLHARAAARDRAARKAAALLDLDHSGAIGIAVTLALKK